jgi:hypothetical protein
LDSKPAPVWTVMALALAAPATTASEMAAANFFMKTP